MDEFYAHIRKDQDGTEKYQTVQEHCEAVAKYAGACLVDAGLEQAAYLAGLLHDGGKLTRKFQEYIVGQGKRGSVIHSFTGVRLLLERFHGPTFSELQDLTSELLAYAVGAHHGQFDCINEKRRSGFRHRLEKPDISYEEAIENLFRQGMAPEELDTLFAQAHGALQPVYAKLMDLADQGPERYGSELAFYLGLLSRLLLSAVIEGDRRDTAEFMTDAVFPEQLEDRRDLWTGRLNFLEAKLACFSADTPIDRARRDISNQCRTCAEQSGGVFRLNVPTGAGKTLSALRFALAHSARWNKARIIFTSPLLSILEQNAQVLRDYIGDDSLILEHHSNVVRTNGETDSLDPYELLEENWKAPIVVTTLVQLLNTLFDGRTSSVRRFQSLVNSVIVIDEVQTVPNQMLSMFNLAVSFLVEVCGATVVLCSATQPCLEQAAHPLAVTPVDMVPYDPALWAAFRRTELQDAGSLSMEEIPGLVWDVLDQADSLLLICNKKDQAADLYRKLEGQGVTCFHLSAAMCMAHRRQVLAELGQALEQSRSTGEKVLCVATQVMEAGVNISFARTVRLLAGMDSVVQSAGRCNRNGEDPNPAPVYVVRCQNEDLKWLSEIQRGKAAAESLLNSFRKAPERFGNDLSGDAAIRFYYQKLYQDMPQGYQDYTVPGKGYSLYSLLSDNRGFADGDCPEYGKYCLQQAFRLAGSTFTVFDQDTTDVLVPWGEGKEVIADLCSDRAGDLDFVRTCLERGKGYTVSLYQHQLEKLEKNQGIVSLCGGSILALREGFYDGATGLTLEPKANGFLEG